MLERTGANESCLSNARELKNHEAEQYFNKLVFEDEQIASLIEELHSADVRPNIHGHWIKINSGDEDFPESIVCDRCNHENSHLDFNEHNEPIGKVFVTSNFCPNCGADMREPKGEKGTE